MVEARGVEPLSENAASKEPTYLVQFQRGPGPASELARPFRMFTPRAKNGQETRAASL